ncbi:uncharacterized protein LOC143889257 [Tasmannia lanceolata]|uniref:uncharacterized protein LOC143889257 n=1 Tax=Tasmannia lanceolata TaxID=3420 RepID=UPI004063553B
MGNKNSAQNPNPKNRGTNPPPVYSSRPNDSSISEPSLIGSSSSNPLSTTDSSNFPLSRNPTSVPLSTTIPSNFLAFFRGSFLNQSGSMRISIGGRGTGFSGGIGSASQYWQTLRDNMRFSGSNVIEADRTGYYMASSVSGGIGAAAGTPSQYSQSSVKGAGICPRYEYGVCKNSSTCCFDHPIICPRYENGICKNGSTCCYDHPQICPRYENGICENASTCPFDHPPICPFTENGICKNGSTCPYVHPLICPFYENGICNKGSTCWYYHPL